jgi:hypothetical protein
MTVPARRLSAQTVDSDLDDDRDDDFATGEFYSGERVCAPPERTGGVLRGIISILVALGGGWALITNQATWRPWLASELAAVAPMVAPQSPGPLATAAVVPPPLPTTTIASPPPPAGDPVPAAKPEPPAAEPTASVETASIESAEPAPAIEPLPPPPVDPADPYQKRAAAVGLHPKLSRVLLARLSATDYRNAGVAIETAVAKTPDTATFVWPRQRTPELALFQVHFVPGAAPHCRRYVVTVTKDRWSTTAPPMEKCGSNVAAGKGK